MRRNPAAALRSLLLFGALTTSLSLVSGSSLSASLLRPQSVAAQENTGITATFCVTTVGPHGYAPVVTRPDWAGEEAAALPYRACGVRISGECMGSWCQITYRQSRGWINMSYLSSDNSHRR